MNTDRLKSIAFGASLVLANALLFAANKPQPAPMPTEFVIGVQTFFDFGPPFNYYDIFTVSARGNGADVERIGLTPAGNECLQPAKAEFAAASIAESVGALLRNVNPCTIPEKELRKEAKRCKKCLVFSGADVGMQVQCGSQQRVIRASVLDRDWFDPKAGTPANTSWTMEIVGRLNNAVGPGVMDKPMFALEDGSAAQTKAIPPSIAKEIEAGKYDGLFAGEADKPSHLIRAAQVRPVAPSVELVRASSVEPTAYDLPKYPPLARQARIEGLVELAANIGNKGNVESVSVVTGHDMLRGAAEAAVAGWKFPPEATGQTIHLKIEFKLNCPQAAGTPGAAISSPTN